MLFILLLTSCYLICYPSPTIHPWNLKSLLCRISDDKLLQTWWRKCHRSQIKTEKLTFSYSTESFSICTAPSPFSLLLPNLGGNKEMKIICIKPKIIKRSLNLNETIRNICIFFFIRQIIYLHTENKWSWISYIPIFFRGNYTCNNRTYLLAAILKNNHILKFFVKSVALFYTFRIFVISLSRIVGFLIFFFCSQSIE